MEKFLHFLQMGGHGWYVWSAYACVFIFLSLEWIIVKKQWQNYSPSQKHLPRKK